MSNNDGFSPIARLHNKSNSDDEGDASFSPVANHHERAAKRQEGGLMTQQATAGVAANANEKVVSTLSDGLLEAMNAAPKLTENQRGELAETIADKWWSAVVAGLAKLESGGSA